MDIIGIKSVALTGHRPSKLPWGYNEDSESCKNFKFAVREIIENLIERGVYRFYTGMAEGFDMITTEILIELREYNDIEIVAVLPCLKQDRLWSKDQQERYRDILDKCDKRVVISKDYTNTCMNDRNCYMVENSSVVFACYDGCSKGGTKNTITIAKSKGRELVVINPNDYV